MHDCFASGLHLVKLLPRQERERSFHNSVWRHTGIHAARADADMGDQEIARAADRLLEQRMVVRGGTPHGKVAEPVMNRRERGDGIPGAMHEGEMADLVWLRRAALDAPPEVELRQAK